MATYLPGYYDGEPVMVELLQTEGEEFDLIRLAITEMLDQFFAVTATWALDRWEEELGLVVPAGLTDADRRERIVSKLRGFGTATKEVVRSVAEAYAFGEVSVEDINDNPAAALPNYTIRVKFISDKGIPNNLADTQRAVREVVPAHLDIIWEFTYNTWDEIDAQNWTWDQVDLMNLTWDQWDNMDL